MSVVTALDPWLAPILQVGNYTLIDHEIRIVILDLGSYLEPIKIGFSTKLLLSDDILYYLLR